MKNIFEYFNLSANLATILDYLDSRKIKRKHIIFIVICLILVCLILVCIGSYNRISEEVGKGNVNIDKRIINSNGINNSIINNNGDDGVNINGDVNGSNIGYVDNKKGVVAANIGASFHAIINTLNEDSVVNSIGDENININGDVIDSKIGNRDSVFIEGEKVEIIIEGMLELTQECVNSEYLKGNYETAFRISEELSKRDNAVAMCNLGYFYENGYGCEKSIYEAEYWYNEAANCGSDLALYNSFVLNMKEIKDYGALKEILIQALRDNNKKIMEYILSIASDELTDFRVLFQLNSEEIKKYFHEWKMVYDFYPVQTIMPIYTEEQGRYYQYLSSDRSNYMKFYRVFEYKLLNENLLETEYVYE